MITDKDKVTLKTLLLGPQWRVFESLAETLCDDIRTRPKIADSEWETLKNVIGDENKIRGIQELVQEINRLASEAR